jgi:hypothetical protein
MTHQPIPGTDDCLNQPITLSCIDPWGRVVDVPTTLGYSVADPYAISLVFHSASGDVEWVVSRTLVLQGLAAPCGEGDVKIYPSIDEEARVVAILDFCSPDGRLIAQADSMELQSFLASTFEMVPVGVEGKHLDIDGMIAALLGAETE